MGFSGDSSREVLKKLRMNLKLNRIIREKKMFHRGKKKYLIALSSDVKKKI